MDPKLEKRWRSGLSPFDGQCLYLDDLAPISNIRRFLISTVNELKPYMSTERLYKFDDWHEHDGYVTQSTMTTVGELEGILVSDESLYTARHGDTFVHWAFYPEDISFLLRFDILDEDEDRMYPGIWGRCDLTARPEIIEAVQSQAIAEIAKLVRIGDAKAYFDQNYAG